MGLPPIDPIAEALEQHRPQFVEVVREAMKDHQHSTTTIDEMANVSASAFLDAIIPLLKNIKQS